MKSLRIMIVDDQVLFAESLKRVIENDIPDFSVVRIAHNGSEALAHIQNNAAPDLILMDVRMPEMNGVEATKAIKEAFPHVKIIMLTTFDDDEYVHQAVKYGASGYLLKDISPADLILSIRAVMTGSVLLSPSVVSKLVDLRADKETGALQDGGNAFLSLNKREKEVFAQLSKGLDNREIAEALFLGQQTVKNYISSIYAKLNVRNRMQAMYLASKYIDREI